MSLSFHEASLKAVMSDILARHQNSDKFKGIIRINTASSRAAFMNIFALKRGVHSRAMINWKNTVYKRHGKMREETSQFLPPSPPPHPPSPPSSLIPYPNTDAHLTGGARGKSRAKRNPCTAFQSSGESVQTAWTTPGSPSGAAPTGHSRHGSAARTTDRWTHTTRAQALGPCHHGNHPTWRFPIGKSGAPWPPGIIQTARAGTKSSSPVSPSESWRTAVLARTDWGLGESFKNSFIRYTYILYLFIYTRRARALLGFRTAKKERTLFLSCTIYVAANLLNQPSVSIETKYRNSWPSLTNEKTSYETLPWIHHFVL